MNTFLNILPWALAILAGVLYYFSRQKAKKAEFLETHSDTLQKMLEEKELDNIRLQKDLEDKSGSISTLKNLVKEYNEENEKYTKRIKSLEDENYAITKELDNSSQPSRNAPVFIKDFDFIYKSEIRANSIKLALSLLIGDNQLFDVFKRLLNSKLLPDSIAEAIHLQPKTLEVLIWTQDYNEDGEPTNSLSWNEIVTQMAHKKRIINEYLLNVIQDSNRAMVVHQALNDVPLKESEVASA